MAKRSNVVLCDVDGVIVDIMPRWLEMNNDNFGTNVKLEDIVSWDVASLFPGQDWDEIFAPLSNPELYEGLRPIEGSLAEIWALRDLEIEVIYVTSATPVHMGIKAEYLREHGFLLNPRQHIPEDYIVARRKGLIHGDVIVDDGAHNLESSRCNKKILFAARHNREEKRFFRVQGWEEASTLIRTFIRRN